MAKQKLFLQASALLAAFSMLLTAVVLTSATFAWFTITTGSANAEAMDGQAVPGEVNLVISATQGGTYDVKAKPTLLGTCETLRPLSTANLTTFYAATAQDRNGKSILFEDASTRQSTDAIHGEVYLKAEYRTADLYFSAEKLKFSGGNQLLAAMRLGLKITAGGQTQTYVFRLDDFAATGGAESKPTTQTGDESVVTGISGGSPAFEADPSKALRPYSATEPDGDRGAIVAGQTALCRMPQDTTVKVEFWLYMEGCDFNCINSAQATDLGMDLAFAAVGVEDGTQGA